MATLTFLGTSDSRGIPRVFCHCEVCLSRAQKNRRTRPSIVIQTKEGAILLDISPDFRQQFLFYPPESIPQDVFITHLHNDHIGGLGDFADVCFWQEVQARVFSPQEMIMGLHQKYAYLTPARGIEMIATTNVWLHGWHISFHQVEHGVGQYAYALRFMQEGYVWAYMPDAFHATEEQLEPFRGIDLLIMGAAYWLERHEPTQRSIYDVQEALQIQRDFSISQVILTHISHDIDHEIYEEQLPSEVTFAWDGLVITLPG